MKNKVLNGITALVVLVWLISICAMDSPTWIPLVVCGLCTLYLAVVNRFYRL